MKNTTKRSQRPDVIKVLAEARPDDLNPSLLADSARQRRDFARIVTESTDIHAANHAETRRRSGFRPLGAVALTAVAASAVVTVGAIDWRGSADRPIHARIPMPTHPASAPAAGTGRSRVGR